MISYIDRLIVAIDILCFSTDSNIRITHDIIRQIIYIAPQNIFAQSFQRC